MEGYTTAFGQANDDIPFMWFHDVLPDKSLSTITFTRGEFWLLARQAAAMLVAHGVECGDHVVHFFTDNSYLDVAFRLAAVMIGSIPVTINWQARIPKSLLFAAWRYSAVQIAGRALAA